MKSTPATQARAEGLIMRGLTNHLLERNVITRVGPDDLFHKGETEGIDIPAWGKAVLKLIEAGSILTYKITDLPATLPLEAAYQVGYTTREHLLELLKKAKPNQVEEIRDFLEYEGVEIPAASIRVAVTTAQKRRIDNAVRKLNEVRAEVADRNPNNRVVWYLDASDNLNLMVEPDGQMEPDQRYITHDTKLRASGGGDW